MPGFNPSHGNNGPICKLLAATSIDACGVPPWFEFRSIALPSLPAQLTV
jgi:hypothetical protein